MFERNSFKRITLILIGLALLLSASIQGQQTKKSHPKPIPNDAKPVLWREPTDIASRDLFLGPGGEAMKPDLSKVTFIADESRSYSKKYRVRDGAGNVWVVKIGPEAQSETAATRLISPSVWRRRRRLPEGLPTWPGCPGHVPGRPDGEVQLARQKEYDVAVVGGGAAGCVVAARLAESPSRSVILLEAGPDLRADLPEEIRDGWHMTRAFDWGVRLRTEGVRRRRLFSRVRPGRVHQRRRDSGRRWTESRSTLGRV